MMPPMSDHDTWNMFAAAALQGMLASPHLADHIKNVGSPPTTMDTYDYVAIAARAYADALLAESKKRETPAPTPPSLTMMGGSNGRGSGNLTRQTRSFSFRRGRSCQQASSIGAGASATASHPKPG